MSNNGITTYLSKQPLTTWITIIVMCATMLVGWTNMSYRIETEEARTLANEACITECQDNVDDNKTQIAIIYNSLVYICDALDRIETKIDRLEEQN